MIGVVAAWTFGAFIYFKVAFDGGMYETISIIASLLLAIVLGIIVFAASGVYAMRLLAYNWTRGRVPASVGALIARTVFHFLGITLSYLVVARLIIFGFSKDLSDDIEMFTYGVGGDRLGEEFIIFIFIVSAPVFAHYALSIFGTYLNANRKRDV